MRNATQLNALSPSVVATRLIFPFLYVETPNRPEFRALILVSKIVQQLANGARPGKQDFMQVRLGWVGLPGHDSAPSFVAF
jgi:hypothetical protein